MCCKNHICEDGLWWWNSWGSLRKDDLTVWPFAVIVGERASGESSHLFHQHHAQQERQHWNRWALGGPDRGTHVTSRSGVRSGPGQTQGKDERSQRGLWSGPLHPSVLRGTQMEEDTAQPYCSCRFTVLLFYVSYFAITKSAALTREKGVAVSHMFLNDCVLFFSVI